jgi:hypothetical protein
MVVSLFKNNGYGGSLRRIQADDQYRAYPGFGNMASGVCRKQYKLHRYSSAFGKYGPVGGFRFWRRRECIGHSCPLPLLLLPWQFHQLCGQ